MKYILGILKNSYRKENTSVLILFLLKILLIAKGFLYVFWYRRHISTAKNNLKYVETSKNGSVFVFANDPSLGDIDFSKIKDFVDNKGWDLITVNSFASKAVVNYNITPTACVFADPYHYIGGEVNGLSEQALLDIDVINGKNILALVPYHFVKNNKFNRFIPFCAASNVYSSNVSDVTKPLGYYPITAFYAVSLALSLRYKNIYICGFDNSYFHDFEVSIDNEKYFLDRHFYDKGDLKKRHIPSWEFKKTSDVFLNFYRHFKYLEKISDHGIEGVSIKNIAKITFTDAFERDFSLDIYKNKYN